MGAPRASASSSSSLPFSQCPRIASRCSRSPRERTRASPALEVSEQEAAATKLLGGGFAVAAASASSASSAASSLAAAAKAALARSLYPEIVNDPFAELLAQAAGVKELTAAEEEQEEERWQKLKGETSTPPPPPPRSALSAAAAAFADATLLYATDLVNLEADPKGAEYRQVVLLGPGLDTRPQRLGWPAGTVLFECASADAHAVAAAALASDGAKELALEAAEEEEEEEEGYEDEEEEEEEEAGEEESVFSSFNGSGAPRGRLLRRVVCDVSTEEGRSLWARPCSPPGSGRRGSRPGA